ncbi:hypothetical protein ACFX1T_020213 [Malus domestica]
MTKRKRGVVMADRISELPDEVLVSIVSLLSLREAAAMRILSTRWRNVWKSTWTLNFDADPKALERERYVTDAETLKERYVKWVDSTLEQHQGMSIEQFRICFNLNERFSSSVDKWVRFAMKKRVQILELNFLEEFPPTYEGALLHVPCYTFSPRQLLGGVPSLQPCSDVGFNFLRVVKFKNVCLAGGLEYFLSNCPALERLTIYRVLDLHKLRVVGLSIPLKYLVIRGCDNIESILIRDANLVSFTYHGLKMNLITRNVPLLAEVSIGGYPKVDFLKVAFTQLESCRSQLQVLKLLQYKIPYDEDRVFPIFSSLKQLEIAVTDQDYWRLHLLTSFIEASPCLHKLVLHLHHSSFTGQRKIFKRAECSHRYLKVVEMVGYDGSTGDFGLVKYLTKTAVNLEEIGVSHFKSWFYHYTDEKPEESERDRAMKDRAMKELKQIVPSTVKLVCL